MTQAKVPVVVVDTTEFRRDLTLSGSWWLQVRLWGLAGKIQLWVPEVVVREAAKHYSTQLNLHLSKLRDADAALGKLNFENGTQPSIEDYRSWADGLSAGYEQWLRDWLGHVGAVILPLPKMPHDEILSRALREEKPFRMKGDGTKKGPDGYRDMLIWASVAEHSRAHLGTSDTLVLVTDNHTDFCEANDHETVAAVLRVDLGDAVPIVLRRAALSELAQLVSAQRHDAAEVKLQQELAIDGVAWTTLRDAVQKECEALADRAIADIDRDQRFGTGLNFDELRLPMDEPRLRWLEVDLEAVHAIVYGTDPDYEPPLILARVSVTAEADIEGFINVYDYDEDSGLSASLINDHVYEVEGTRAVALQFNAGIDPDGSIAFLDLEKAVPATQQS